MNTAFSALLFLNNYFTSDNKHYVKFTDFILNDLNMVNLALLAIMIAYFLNNYCTSDNVHYVKCANTYTKNGESACNDNNTMIQYCQR